MHLFFFKDMETLLVFEGSQCMACYLYAEVYESDTLIKATLDVLFRLQIAGLRSQKKINAFSLKRVLLIDNSGLKTSPTKSKRFLLLFHLDLQMI